MDYKGVPTMKARRKLRQSKSHVGLWVAAVLVLAIGFLAWRGVASVMTAYAEWTDDLPTIDKDSFSFAEESYMYASDGTTLLASFELEKRTPVENDAISDYVLKATVDVEDIRFYDHNGVDIPGIIRAVVNNLAGGALEGASTITQQLVRNTVLSEEATDITLRRKAREAELALALERNYSKQEILNMYLNTINYGDGCYGIEAAAQNYFQVPAKDLTLAQAATLVGIPQSPTRFNPKENPQACTNRRNLVLNRMLTAGDITQEEYDAAVAADLDLNPAPDKPAQGIYAYPYFTSFVRDSLLEDNNIYNCSFADLFEGGLKIYTTLDVDLQDMAEEACDYQYDIMEDGLDCALVAMDPRNGFVRAIVGGKDFYEDQWNVATQGGRPTGSTFKVFTLVAAIEAGINPKSRIDCSNPVTLANGQTINNFGYGSYGVRTIDDALAISSNTGFYRLADKVGAGALVEVAHRMGIKSSLSPYPIITLGTENCTLLEMAEAYSTLAAEGIHHDYVIIERIENKKGEVLYEANTEGKRVVDERVAGAAIKVMRGVFEKSYATAGGSGPSNGQPVAGKTGTGVDYRDHLLVGFCPYLTCSCWIGNRDYSPTSPSLTANYLWHNFMSMACAGHDIEYFPDVADPEYTITFEDKVADLKDELEDVDPGDLKEGDLNNRWNEFEKHITYQESDKYEKGYVISIKYNESTGVIDVVVSSGKKEESKSSASPSSSAESASSGSSQPSGEGESSSGSSQPSGGGESSSGSSQPSGGGGTSSGSSSATEPSQGSASTGAASTSAASNGSAKKTS